MESRRLGVLVALALTVSVVAVGAGYISGGGSGEAPEGEPPDDIYTGPEDLNASNGNASSLGWLCGAGATDAYGNYSPDSYADYDYELANSSDGPTDERYVNVYEPGEPPEWIPESEFSMENHRAGTYEVTRYPNAEPTQEDLDAAWRLYNRSFEAAKENGWFEFEEAKEDGYSKEGAHRHWSNVENISMHAEEDIIPGIPENLVYYQDPDGEGKILAGFMYHKPIGSDVEGEQVGGSLTVWHYHPQRTARYPEYMRRWVSSNDDLTGEEVFNYLGADFESIEEYEKERDRTSEMMHVWFVRHPEGPFATSMSVPQSSLKEPEKMNQKRFNRYAAQAGESDKQTVLEE
ncbi:hypothetical protein EGH25_08525 [Haladaptatus sp. F3-133]|uniref:Uncharacterized protein n=1 Tax=Halorutilus salinus TaxID=2487751 RepID=A0A9Q4C4N5_9EURY|nr:hypothetical protein [Halorutilus salinus]MCX2819393.1 hypothetical protein [Halorutilus salinus]